MSLFLLVTLLGVFDGEISTLQIHSQPGAEVLWEGVSLGVTDSAGVLTVSDIPPGTFTVVVQKAGFGTFQRSVTIVGGETTSLEAALRPADAGPASRSIPKPPQTKKIPESGKRAEPIGSDQDNRLTQLLKSAPKQGPLPVWPAASRPASQRSGLGVPIWPFILGGTLLILVLWLSRKLKPASFSRPPALLADDSDQQPKQAQTTEKTAAFLSDLKKREELLEQGVEILPGRVKGPVIDLDSNSVREVKEQ